MKGQLPIFATLTLGVACSLLAPSAARAQTAERLEQEIVPVPEVRPELKREPVEKPDDDWYGYRIIGTDALGWVAIFGGAELHSGAAILTGTLLLLLGGPIIHTSADNGPAAAQSFFSRLLMPLAGLAVGVLGAVIAGSDDESGLDPLVAGGYGALFGIAVSEILDWTVYSTPDPGGADPGPAPGPSSRPMMMFIRGTF